VNVTLSAPFVLALALAFVRSVAWVQVCPPFNNATVPRTMQIIIAASLALFSAGPLSHDPLPNSDADLITALVVQAGVGTILGFVVSIFVNAIVGAGSLIDLFSGLNLPAAIDPMSLQQTKLFGQLYNMVTTALLFTTGSVVVIAGGFVRSFSAVGTTLPSTTLGNAASVITNDVVTFMVAALEIAAPLIVILFATQILLALLAKAAPQVNVFVFGMPLQIIVALIGVGVAIAVLPSEVTNLVGQGMAQLFGGI
jgi:flagellar biosynthesis protein FliR